MTRAIFIPSGKTPACNEMLQICSRAASRKPWPAGQIWPADLIQLARVGMLSTLIFLVMSTK